VLGIDWSGARDRSAQVAGIRCAEMRAEGCLLSGGRTRAEMVDELIRSEGPVLAGLDFSFGFPAWFARAHGCATIDDVWTLAALDGEAWLRAEPPFWRERCDLPVGQRYRACELRLRTAGFPAKSIFQLVGNGQVGAGSVRGMPLLARLRAEGFAIWPFDPAGMRTVFEVYPTAMRAVVDLGDDFLTTHDRDAAHTAAAMAMHADDLVVLKAATDPVTRIEGDVWTPR
jgi:hypothetical protein